MEKQDLFASLKSQFPNEIIDINNLDEKKIEIQISDSIRFDEPIRKIRKSILKSGYEKPLLVRVTNGKLIFNFSAGCGIYEFAHHDAEYRVEYDLITYKVSINGETNIFKRATFEKSELYKDIIGYIDVIRYHREKFFGYSNII